jgi:hypothetical protein
MVMVVPGYREGFIFGCLVKDEDWVGMVKIFFGFANGVGRQVG